MHVGVTDRHGEDHSPNKLVRILFGRFGPQHGGEIGVAVAFVFVVGKNAEDLREILHVNAPAGGRAVETLDGQRAGPLTDAYDAEPADPARTGLSPGGAAAS